MESIEISVIDESSGKKYYHTIHNNTCGPFKMDFDETVYENNLLNACKIFVGKSLFFKNHKTKQDFYDMFKRTDNLPSLESIQKRWNDWSSTIMCEINNQSKPLALIIKFKKQ